MAVESTEQRAWRIRDRVPRLVTVATAGVAAAALGVNLVLAVLAWPSPAPWAGLVLEAAGLLLAFRSPGPALALTALAPLADGLLGWPPTLTWSIVCFVGLLITLRGVSALLAGPVLAVANLVGVWLVTGSVDPAVNAEAAIAGFLALLFVAVGSAVRNNHDFRAALELRARDAIATRDEAIRRSVAEERVRIARDLHDGVGHQVAVLSMHLGTAEARLGSDAAATRDALTAARGDLQTLLRETQSILQLLKGDQEPELTGPTADHRNLPGLIETFRDAGLELDATLPDLAAIELTPAASTAAYRIVQESLTNASRHGAGPVTLRIEVRTGGLHIEVRNPLRTDGLVRSGSGQGLVGMDARASAAGGRLETRSEATGFGVSAELPLRTENR